MARGNPASDDPVEKTTGALLVEHVIGIVTAVHMPGEYVSPVNNLPVQSHVVELDGGHTFVFDGDAPAATVQGRFHELSHAEAKFTLATAHAVAELQRGAARLAAAMRVQPPVAMRLVVALLKSAQFALQAGAKGKPSPEPPAGPPLNPPHT